MPKPSWLQDLERDGFVVVPQVVLKDVCDDFVESGWAWLESFPHGFQRDARSTWNENCLPFGQKGGLYNRCSVNHEAFVWKIRTYPGIIKVFEQIWDTEDLVVSLDGVNITLPISKESGRTDIEPTEPWPDIDQDPRKADRFELYQGIANFSPCGPQDGGLCVLKGSHLLHTRNFEQIGGFREKQDLGVGKNGYDFTNEDADWYKSQGCEEIKVCANAGDLIVWDSRTIHWNASPAGDQTRFVSYVCYAPRSFLSEAGLARKFEIFQSRKGTTHWPHENVVPADRPNYFNAIPRRPDGSVDPANRTRPFQEPEETALVMRLVGARGLV
ncbi:uncharacterized protein BCR38DRAFT_374424 [Pseudomassariella vexata]|uniref:Phytanoyl-CoA dioxygenase n=1 Tax=Pseudomassariella vexata TaxID=1141098 RepID=A0A1Y2DND6_9PEZI|nr:uncharacterized protein BCR38DRAFT_374424 [Pseudomassariella vexata]ORY60782.1 hypothetical protein BCR38DRAFT_374424 [Pseudomassariella vexata]